MAGTARHDDGLCCFGEVDLAGVEGLAPTARAHRFLHHRARAPKGGPVSGSADGQADDCLVEAHRTGGTGEDGVTEGEDAAVRGGEQVPVP